MEFRVARTGRMPTRECLEQALLDADPAAVFDIDAGTGVLRIAASIEVDGLRALLRKVGCEVAREDVAVLPSICCGGCSG